MSESGVIGERRRRSRVEADGLAQEYERSGQTRLGFCQQHGLSTASLDNYRRRWMQQSRCGQKPSSRILPVEWVGAGQDKPSTSPVTPELWVELAKGRRIEVGRGFDEATLERLLAVLERSAPERA